MKLCCFMLIVAASFFACKKEEKLTAESQSQYQLPQGNHPYDQRIVDFHQQYGTYILYKFNEVDFRWNIVNRILFQGIPADEDRVENALNFLDKELFGYYEPVLLKRLLPFKVMLCKDIIPLDPFTEKPTDGLADVVQTESHIAFGHVDKRWDNFSIAQKIQVKGLLHGTLWEKAIRGKNIEITPDFVDGISYQYVNELNYKNFGLFASTTNSLGSDVKEYVRRITSHTKAELETLYFNAEFDPTGIYRRKYDALVTFCKTTYNIDLQAIGEAGLH